MRVLAIDLDGCALLHPSKVQSLYENKDNLIIIYTARSSKIRKETEEELRRNEIPYHALVMDKLRADVYIDDKNIGGLKWNE
jgi:uncharacterized HAD superfamily protein